MLPRRFWTPLAVTTLLGSLWIGERVLCSCGGPSAPPTATDSAPTEAAPAPNASPEAPPALPDFSDPSWTRTPSASGQYLIAWRPAPAPIARNQDFALDVWVLEDGAPRNVTGLAVSAWMPDHGHGMLRAVRPEARPDGSYRVENMLLHMRGHWLIVFDLLEGTLSERAEHSLEL
jgi:hypothetical protein